MQSRWACGLPFADIRYVLRYIAENCVVDPDQGKANDSDGHCTA